MNEKDQLIDINKRQNRSRICPILLVEWRESLEGIKCNHRARINFTSKNFSVLKPKFFSVKCPYGWGLSTFGRVILILKPIGGVLKI